MEIKIKTMQANELRIGNLVTDEFYDSCKTIIEVDSISDKGINLFVEDDGNWPECAQTWIEPERRFDTLRPIPLTEEWLLKFRFQPDGLGHLYLDLEDDFYGFVDRGEEGFMLVIGGTEHKETYIKHVHSLQNLFFALTGKELTLKK